MRRRLREAEDSLDLLNIYLVELDKFDRLDDELSPDQREWLSLLTRDPEDRSLSPIGSTAQAVAVIPDQSRHPTTARDPLYPREIWADPRHVLQNHPDHQPPSQETVYSLLHHPLPSLGSSSLCVFPVTLPLHQSSRKRCAA